MFKITSSDLEKFSAEYKTNKLENREMWEEIMDDIHKRSRKQKQYSL